MASIQKRENSRWRARYRDDAGKEHARHFDRKVDAQRWLDEVTTALVTGDYVDPVRSRMTFDAFFADWSTRQVWETTTGAAMRLAAGSVTFGAVPLAKLRASHVEAWVKAMQVRKLQPSTIRTRVNNVRTVLRAAVRDRRLARDPSEGVTLPRVRRAEAAMDIPSTELVGALLRAADGFRPFVAVCAFAGLRLGEAAALQRGDVDFLRRTIRVERQVQRAAGGRVELRPPKYGSERTVYVPDALLEILGEHVEADAAVDAWLFPGENGNPLHQNSVGYLWRRTRDRAEAGTLKLHGLRHFYASGLIADGCDVVTVQRALGHKSPTVTLATYSHLWPTAEDRTRKAAQGLALAALADPVRTPGVNSAADQRS